MSERSYRCREHKWEFVILSCALTERHVVLSMVEMNLSNEQHKPRLRISPLHLWFNTIALPAEGRKPCLFFSRPLSAYLYLDFGLDALETRERKLEDCP